MADTGRPPIYSDRESLQNAVDLYFIQCDNQDKPVRPTITGLALALGFCSRGTINEYAQKPEFSDIIKKAMLKVECAYETALGGAKPTGSIFALTNMGWKNNQHVETEHSGEISIKITDYRKPAGDGN